MCNVMLPRDLAAAAKIFAQSILRFARKWCLKDFLFCFFFQDGRLRKGDQLIAVDNQPIVGLTHAEVNYVTTFIRDDCDVNCSR